MHVIDFLLGAFRALGVPRILYTDNDAVIVSRRMQRAASILNRAFADTGGFRLDQHLPGNAQATGKVEVAHQMVEKFEKLIGVKYTTPDLASLDKFCAYFCERVNWLEHRETREKPMLRWQSKHTLIRVPPPAVLDSAFKADEFTRRLNSDLTISFGGESYQLPRKRPFVDWIGRALTVVWPPDSDFFVVVGIDGFEYEITRVVARADAAGEFKAPEESAGQRATKRLRASAAERARAHKDAGTELLVPGFDSEAETAGRPALMPKPRVEMDAALLAALAPGAVPPSHTAGRQLTYFQAVEFFQREGLLTDPLDAATQKWLKAVFNGREHMTDAHLREEIEAHNQRRQPTVGEIQRRA